MKKHLAFFLGILFSAGCYAQNTAITATVVDSDGTVWAGGTWTMSLVPGPSNSNPMSYTVDGGPVSSAIINQSGTMNGSGVATMSVYTTSHLAPTGSKWLFNVCPKASAPCSQYTFLAVGTTQDISSALTTIIIAPRFQAISGSYGYADVEANTPLLPGSRYYNVTNNIDRIYSGVSWSNGGASGSTVWSALTAPVSNLSLGLGSNTSAFTYTIPFTAQASFASAWTHNVGGINFGTDWNNIYSAFMPNAYPSDGLDVGLAMPNTAAVFQSNALGVFANCAQPGGKFCVGLYAQGVRGASGSAVNVLNANGTDNNLPGTLLPAEFNSQVKNVGTTGATGIFTANITNAGTAYDGIDVGGYGSVGFYRYAYSSFDDNATVALNIGKLTSSGGSQPIRFFNGSLIETLFLNAASLFQYSNPIIAPSFSTSLNCISAATPAVCGDAAAGLVAVPTGGTTLVVNTTVVGANSEIIPTFDSSLGTALGITCNTTINQPTISARTAGISFTIAMASSVTTNKACISYHIVNAQLAPTGQMLDTFSGVNGTTLASHTADTGQAWARFNNTNWTNTLTLNGSNALTGGLSAYASNLVPSSANYTVSLGANVTGAGAGWIFVGARLNTLTATSWNGYGCRLAQGVGTLLEKWVAGVNTQIGTTDVSATGGTHTIAIVANGTTLTCKVDGVSSAQATGTDATYAAAGAVGMGLNLAGGTNLQIISPFTVQ